MKKTLRLALTLATTHQAFAVSDEFLESRSQKNSSASQAAIENDPPASRTIVRDGKQITLTTHSLNTSGRKLQFVSYSYLNENGTPEVAYEFVDLRPFMGSSSPVLFGRDLDNDGAMDAWFLPVSPGVLESVDRESSSSGDGWDVAQDILVNRVKVGQRSFLSMLPNALNAASESFTITGASTKSYFAGLNKRIMNALELEIRSDRMFKEQPTNPYSALAVSWLSEEWQSIDADISQKFWINSGLVVADMGVTAALSGIGQVAVKGMGRISSWIGPKLITPEIDAWAQAVTKRIGENLAAQSERVIARLKLKPFASAVAKIGVVRESAVLAAMNSAQRVTLALQAMQGRSTLERLTANALLKIGEVAGHGVKEMGYISQVVGILAVTELVIHAKEIAHPNPFIVVQKAATNKELLQSVVFMSDETFLQAAITASSSNIPRRMMITGVVSAVDSLSVGTLLKGTSDPRRAALDTSWQAIVGNGQTNVELIAIKHFEQAAVRSANPRLKLVGWAIVYVSQSLGFIGYEQAVEHFAPTDKHTAKDANSVKLVPVFVDIEASPTAKPHAESFSRAAPAPASR